VSLRTRAQLEDIVRQRNSCSGGRAEGCTTCGLRHTCRLDDSAEISSQALRAYSALYAQAYGSATVRAMLREIEWEDADDED
jgi:hypothetical protein